MASYNRVILLGNMTRDPQLSYLPSGTAAIEFGVATNRKWSTQDGQQREDVCFVDCRMYGKRAEVIQRYFKKGMPIFVEGHLVFDTWTAQDGSKRSRHRVHVDGFEFVGGGSSQSQGSDYSQPQQAQGGYNQGGYGGNQPPQQYSQPTGGNAQQNHPPSAPPMPNPGQMADDSFDPDDIPF